MIAMAQSNTSGTRPLPFARYRPRPSHPDWSRLATEAHDIVRRVEPNLESPQSGLREAKRQASSYRTALRNYAENRRRARAGREDLLPLYFVWTTLRSCNFDCEYCDDHRGSKYPDLDARGKLDTRQAIDLLRVMRTRTPSVYFAGGEPTIRKDLPTLTRAARDLDYYPIVLNTNGSLLHRLLDKPQWAGFLADLDILVVSLDALGIGRLRTLWGTKTPEDVMRNLLVLRDLAAAQRVKLMVNTVVQPGLVREARAVLDLADDLGIWVCPVPRNVGPRVDPAVLADPEYPAFVAELLARKKAGAKISGSYRMLSRLMSARPFDCRNTLKPHIDHDGRLVWPCKAAAAPAWINVLQYDHVDALWADATKHIDPTGFHGDGPDQCGGDCCWAQNYSTDEYVHGLLHPMSLARTVGGFLRR